MNIKQTMRNLVLGALLLIPVVAVVFPSSTYAAENSCAGVDTAVIKCSENKDSDATPLEKTGLWSLLILIINIMTTGVGLLAVAGIVYGGILYTTSGGSPEQIKKARTIFTNVVIGVIAFGGMYALLNFIIPGGVFNP